VSICCSVGSTIVYERAPETSKEWDLGRRKYDYYAKISGKKS